jgi:hypothetical protein
MDSSLFEKNQRDSYSISVLMIQYSQRGEDMEKFDEKIVSAIKQDPSYNSLDGLSHDVWHRIRDTRADVNTGAWFNFTLSPAMKAFSLVLVLGSCIALSQISLNKRLEPDLFDLRYFSYQSLTTTTLLSMNDQGLLP